MKASFYEFLACELTKDQIRDYIYYVEKPCKNNIGKPLRKSRSLHKELRFKESIKVGIALLVQNGDVKKNQKSIKLEIRTQDIAFGLEIALRGKSAQDAVVYLEFQQYTQSGYRL